MSQNLILAIQGMLWGKALKLPNTALMLGSKVLMLRGLGFDPRGGLMDPHDYIFGTLGTTGSMPATPDSPSIPWPPALLNAGNVNVADSSSWNPSHIFDQLDQTFGGQGIPTPLELQALPNSNSGIPPASQSMIGKSSSKASSRTSPKEQIHDEEGDLEDPAEYIHRTQGTRTTRPRSEHLEQVLESSPADLEDPNHYISKTMATPRLSVSPSVPNIADTLDQYQVEAEEIQLLEERQRREERDERIAYLEAERRREERIKQQDEEIRRRPPIPPPIPLRQGRFLRPVINQTKALLDGLSLDDEVGDRVLVTEVEIMRRMEERDRAIRARLAIEEEEALKRRLRDRIMSKRRLSVGPGGRRHRVIYDDGVYRWE
ncbi:hypothetical protein L207DRAFT_197723 [Hyaloscypha variabilis F]|uniref:Uncharacterized protein n=1 Tax=Hyaloscypha variabilis (strain UAMH 11265 / GT02V1 / F) TaxID=1149755 RepID=A0A2J6QXW5_HYAVF|nr:hypothetical protein L207DRAFT_197723 [Hyaloscypha variabilis F]